MSSGAINPIANPQAYDTILIGGVENPGIVPPGGISGFKREHEWDVKKGKGASGATITYVQRPPAKGSIKFWLWNAAMFSDWEEFRPQFKYDPTKKNPQAVDIFHPTLADLDIKSVVCTSISALEHDGYGLWTCTVELMEYFPPPKKSAVGTPSTSQTNTNPNANVQPNAQDAQQAEIAALMAQASAP